MGPHELEREERVPEASKGLPDLKRGTSLLVLRSASSPASSGRPPRLLPLPELLDSDGYARAGSDSGLAAHALRGEGHALFAKPPIAEGSTGPRHGSAQRASGGEGPGRGSRWFLSDDVSAQEDKLYLGRGLVGAQACPGCSVLRLCRAGIARVVSKTRASVQEAAMSTWCKRRLPLLSLDRALGQNTGDSILCPALPPISPSPARFWQALPRA